MFSFVEYAVDADGQWHCWVKLPPTPPEIRITMEIDRDGNIEFTQPETTPEQHRYNTDLLVDTLRGAGLEGPALLEKLKACAEVVENHFGPKGSARYIRLKMQELSREIGL